MDEDGTDNGVLAAPRLPRRRPRPSTASPRQKPSRATACGSALAAGAAGWWRGAAAGCSAAIRRTPRPRSSRRLGLVRPAAAVCLGASAALSLEAQLDRQVHTTTTPQGNSMENAGGTTANAPLEPQPSAVKAAEEQEPARGDCAQRPLQGMLPRIARDAGLRRSWRGDQLREVVAFRHSRRGGLRRVFRAQKFIPTAARNLRAGSWKVSGTMAGSWMFLLNFVCNCHVQCVHTGRIF